APPGPLWVQRAQPRRSSPRLVDRTGPPPRRRARSRAWGPPSPAPGRQRRGPAGPTAREPPPGPRRLESRHPAAQPMKAGTTQEGSTMTATRVTIVYETMFGSTRRIAEAIARGLGSDTPAPLVRVTEASDSITDTDLLIVGAPTHVHGLSRPQTRADAAKWAADPERDLELEPGADGPGGREWLDRVDELPARSAVFDTRADIPEIFSGSAAKKIEHELR